MDIAKVMSMNNLLTRFNKDVNETYDYHFKVISPSDYELKLIFTAKSKVLDSVFNQVKKVLATTKPQLKNTNPSLIERFTVPEEFNNRVHTAIRKNIKQIDRKALNQDGVFILRSSVAKCEFIKREDKLNIEIDIKGQYVKK